MFQHIARIALTSSVLTMSALACVVSADELEFRVNTSYIDMHTGPGRGFPKFYAIARGESFTVLKQRTSWVKVETTKARRGWIKIKHLEDTLTLDGRRVRLP